MAIRFLDPRKDYSGNRVIPANRLESLTNKRLGLLWNGRVGGDRILRHVAELLDQKYNLSEVYFTKKVFIGNAAPPEIIEDLASKVEAVIVGVGD